SLHRIVVARSPDHHADARRRALDGPQVIEPRVLFGRRARVAVAFEFGEDEPRVLRAHEDQVGEPLALDVHVADPGHGTAAPRDLPRRVVHVVRAPAVGGREVEDSAQPLLLGHVEHHCNTPPPMASSSPSAKPMMTMTRLLTSPTRWSPRGPRGTRRPRHRPPGSALRPGPAPPRRRPPSRTRRCPRTGPS